jgi:predicted small lipoprotein YifL
MDAAMRTIRPAIMLIPLLLVLLCGCGNKGDLVKPTPPADAQPSPAPTHAQTPPDSGQH